MFHIVLVEPEIPHNTGAIGRLCLATGSTLHLVGPLGFSLEEKAVRRAGLDYWREVDQHSWTSLEELADAHPEARRFYLSTRGSRPYWEQNFAKGDFLIFGSETRGLPASLLDANADRTLTIPQKGVRSLNLATAAGIVLYEGMRQLSV